MPLVHLREMFISAVGNANNQPTDGSDLAPDFSTEENSTFSCKTKQDISVSLKRKRGRPRNNPRKQKVTLVTFATFYDFVNTSGALFV